MEYYVGFDCATKTLAFNLCKIDKNGLSSHAEIQDEALRLISSITELNIVEITEKIKNLDSKLKQTIQIIDGEVVDLLPGVCDDDIHPVQRISLLIQYLKRSVIPNVPEGAIIIVEYQMAQNHKSDMIAHAIIAAFIEKHDVHMVNTVVKNKIHLSQEGAMSNFSGRHINSKIDVKAQVIFNFDLVGRRFISNLGSIEKKLLEHISDSFMQILGWIKYGESCEILFESKKNKTKKKASKSPKNQIIPLHIINQSPG